MKQVALITGGTRGLGRRAVLAFARAGYHTAYTYGRNASDAEKLAEELEAMGASYYFGQADAGSEEQTAAFIAQVKEKWGRIDVLVNNAGIFENSLLDQMTLESWEKVMKVNLTGSFLAIKHVFPVMKEQGSGRILCMSSIMGETGIYGSCSYGASKAGLIGLMKSAALEGARYGITANAITVGLTDEGMSLDLSDKARDAMLKKIPAGKVGSSDDLAEILVSLCRKEMSFVTGQVIRFNGGQYM